jgi:CDP-diglyceride synthetase
MDILEHKWMQYNAMYKLTDVIEFLLQSRFRNPIEFYYIWIVSLCISCNVIENVWWLSSILWTGFLYFDDYDNE